MGKIRIFSASIRLTTDFNYGNTGSCSILCFVGTQRATKKIISEIDRGRRASSGTSVTTIRIWCWTNGAWKYSGPAKRYPMPSSNEAFN